MQTITDMIYTTIFDCIAVIQNLIYCNSVINCKSFADYARFIIQKVDNTEIIDLDIKEFLAYMKVAKKLAI